MPNLQQLLPFEGKDVIRTSTFQHVPDSCAVQQYFEQVVERYSGLLTELRCDDRQNADNLKSNLERTVISPARIRELAQPQVAFLRRYEVGVSGIDVYVPVNANGDKLSSCDALHIDGDKEIGGERLAELVDKIEFPYVKPFRELRPIHPVFDVKVYGLPATLKSYSLYAVEGTLSKRFQDEKGLVAGVQLKYMFKIQLDDRIPLIVDIGTTITVTWGGKNKHFTHDYEMYAHRGHNHISSKVVAHNRLVEGTGEDVKGDQWNDSRHIIFPDYLQLFMEIAKACNTSDRKKLKNHLRRLKAFHADDVKYLVRSGFDVRIGWFS